MAEYLELIVDKFIFKVAVDRSYSAEGVWVKLDGSTARIGISDYLQQRSGDVAFVELKPEGTLLSTGEEIIILETIKVNLSLSSPFAGRIVEVNLAILTSPEVINQDPYGDGWCAVVELADTSSVLKNLLGPQAYYNKIKLEADEEVTK